MRRETLEEMERTLRMARKYAETYDPSHPHVKLMRLGLSDVVAEEVLILLEMKNES